MTTPSPVRSSLRRLSSKIDPAVLMLVVGPVMICFAWIVTFGQITKDRNRALAEGYRDANGLSRSFAEQTRHRLDDLDQMTRVVRQAYLTAGPGIDIPELLTSAGFLGAQQVKLGVVDADYRTTVGEVPDYRQWLSKVLPSGPSVIDRPRLSTALQAQARRPDMLVFSRPLTRPDGAFSGAVVASVSLQQFLSNLRKLNVGPMSRQFGTVELGPEDIAAILGLDGRVRAALVGGVPVPVYRWPKGQVIKRLKDGTIQQIPQPEVDAVPRLWSGGYLGEYRLIVVVGISREGALREFNRHRRIYLAGTTAFTLCVGLLTILAAVLARRERRTLQRLARSEREANRLKSDFLARISHDLRTPLNGILGFAELVKTTAGEPEQRQYGEYIHDSAGHLLDLVNMILDLTKLRHGKLALQLRDTDLRQMAMSVSRTHSIVAEGKGLAYRLTIADDFPETVTCDGVRIREVLNNLVHNAVKFTRAGRIAMDLGVDGEDARIRVSDTGIGLSDEVKSHLFEPFSEGRDEFSMAQAGAGLGLAFSRELIALHGGRIEVESQQGEGTTVTFWIPLRGPATTEGTHHAQRPDSR